MRLATAFIAAALVAWSSTLPLWTLRMKAPQYPKGLRLDAYGTSMQGDIRELNILNHYIGMQPLEMPHMEAAVYPIGIAVLVALCLLSPLHRYLRRLATAAIASTPVFMLADLQWRLYTFGHSLNPQAPIRLKPFTPLVLGNTTMGNFVTFSMISSGIALLLLAAIVLGFSGRITNRLTKQRPRVNPQALPRAAAALVVSLVGIAVANAETLQQRVDAAPRGGTLTVDGGTHRGPVLIRGPLTVVGANGASIDGGGVGSVVTIEGNDVTFRGFAVRNSGTQVTEEAAGIKLTGDRHVIENNDVREVYFGIHVGSGTGQIVRGNHIVPGERHGARPGHGISVWHARDTRIMRNRISEARDGIYLSFTEGVQASGNEVTGCRYGMHSMYSQNATFAENTLTANLLGAALMMSDRLVLRGNRIAQHRLGTAAYGVLLKDIGDLVAEDNTIVANRIGIYAEGVPSQASRTALAVRNVIAGNEVGLALQSNAALTLSENRIAENLTDVRALGRQLSAGMRWSRDRRGNSWSQYRGYDANGDGVGDLPHRVDEAMDALVRRNPQAQAFLYTPAHRALEAAARMFPLYRHQALLVDEHPLMTSPAGGAR